MCASRGRRPAASASANLPQHARVAKPVGIRVSFPRHGHRQPLGGQSPRMPQQLSHLCSFARRGVDGGFRGVAF
eukprot:5162613-Pleurochrysis_carterae.AAC.1